MQRELSPLAKQGQQENSDGTLRIRSGRQRKRPWNAGRKLGAKRALKPQQVWAIRFWLDREGRLRDRAMFDLAIDSKLRGCDVVKIKIGDLVVRRPGPEPGHRRPAEDGPARSVRAARSGAGQHPGLAGTPRRIARRLRLPEPDRPRPAHQHPPVCAAGRRVGDRDRVAAARTTARTRSGGPRRRSSTSRPATCGRCRSCSATPRSRARCAISAWMSRTRSPCPSAPRCRARAGFLSSQAGSRLS